MVGNIKKGMLAGSQMLTEPKVTWRQGIGEAIVGAVDKAAQAKQQFDEREKNLVWSRLDLEAANLQAEELENIRTAGSIDDVLAIKKDFESKIKANMDGQKWGKEWIEQKGSSYFTANQNDVAKAFRAKEKELTGIEMDKTLTAYADAMANADEEQAEILKQRAYAMIDQDGKGLFSPEEMQKTKNGLDSLVATKRNDIIRQQKWAIEQEKIALNQQIADLVTKAIEGTLTREELDMAKKNGVFKYAPNKYNEILKYKVNKDSDFPNDEATTQYIKDNWANMTEEKLQKYNHDGLINNSTYNHYSAQLKKIKGGSSKGKDTEKAEIGKALLDRVRAGEDVSADLTETEATGQITTAQATAIRNEQKRIQGFSETTKTAINDIKAGKITEDAQINDLGLPNKVEIDYVKGYLKDYLSAQKNKMTQDFDDISKEVIDGNIDNVQVLKDDVRFDSFDVKQQKELIKGVEDVQKAKIEKVIFDGKEQIRKNWIKDNQELNEYILQNDLSVEKAEELIGFYNKWTNDKDGILKSALSLGDNLLPKGYSSAEITARKSYEDYVYGIYDKAIEQGKSPAEISSLLNNKSLRDYILTIKPSDDDIAKSKSDINYTKLALDEKENKLGTYDKETKEWAVNEETKMPQLVDYYLDLEASRKDGNIKPKDYDDKKRNLAKLMLGKIEQIEKKRKGKTLMGNLYSGVVTVVGDKNLPLIERTDILINIAKEMEELGIPLDLESNGWFDYFRKNKTLADNAIEEYNKNHQNKISELSPYIIRDAVLRAWVKSIDPNFDDNADVFIYGDKEIPLNSRIEFENQREETNRKKQEAKEKADTVVPGLIKPNRQKKNDLIDAFREMDKEDR